MIVEREDREGIALLRMIRGKVNALDAELLRALGAALDEAEGSARAVVLTGAGPALSAGVDLFPLLESGCAYVREFLPLLEDTLRRLFSFPRPTVAAVNGHAIAGAERTYARHQFTSLFAGLVRRWYRRTRTTMLACGHSTRARCGRAFGCRASS